MQILENPTAILSLRESHTIIPDDTCDVNNTEAINLDRMTTQNCYSLRKYWNESVGRVCLRCQMETYVTNEKSKCVCLYIV